MVNLQSANLEPQRDGGSEPSAGATTQSDDPLAQSHFARIIEALLPLSVADDSFDAALMGLRENPNAGERK